MRHFSRHMYDLVVTGDVTNDITKSQRLLSIYEEFLFITIPKCFLFEISKLYNIRYKRTMLTTDFFQVFWVRKEENT